MVGANRDEYVRLYTQYLLVDSVATQSDAFLRGFESVCGGEAIELSPHISPTSHHISSHLTTPPRISPHLPTPPHTSLSPHLPTSPHLSQHLPTPPHT